MSYAGSTTDASSKFTAQVDGIYHFDIRVAGVVYADLRDIDVRVKLYKNGIAVGAIFANTSVNFDATDFEGIISLDLALNANDKVWVSVLQDNPDGEPADLSVKWNYFTGHLVFAE